MIILSEHVFTFAKRIKVQRAQLVVINSLHEVKNFEAILQMQKVKQGETKLVIPVKMHTIRRCKYCSQVHKPRQSPVYEKCEQHDKVNHFKEVCRSSKGSTVHNIKKEDEQEQETDIETLNINFIIFNSNHSTIII